MEHRLAWNSLCRTIWTQTQEISLPVPASRVLGLNVCTPTPDSEYFFKCLQKSHSKTFVLGQIDDDSGPLISNGGGHTFVLKNIYIHFQRYFKPHLDGTRDAPTQPSDTIFILPSFYRTKNQHQTGRRADTNWAGGRGTDSPLSSSALVRE